MSKEFDEVLAAGRQAISTGPNRVRPGILVLGAMESGKTSLIASILDEDTAILEELADEDGRPAGFPTYMGTDFGQNINLMDSPGHDLEDSFEGFLAYWNEIDETWRLQEQFRPLEKPHAVWYCIPTTQKRVGRYDYRVLRKLRDIPELTDRVAVVLTQCDKDKNGSAAHSFTDNLTSTIGEDLPVFRYSTEPRLSLDKDAMMEWALSKLNEEDLEDAFISSQMQILRGKKKKAKKAIKSFELTTGSLGALHRWDTETLTAAQCSLARRIVHIYGLDEHIHVSADVFSAVVTSALEESLAGKVLKRTPIVDALSRECCSAAIAVQMTQAIGKAVSKICFKRCKKEILGEEVDMNAALDPDEILGYTRLAM